MTFSDIEQDGISRITRKEKFLSEMNLLIPFTDWIALIKPYYIKQYTKSNAGRPQKNIEVMLRMYLLQTWFTLSDEAVEDAIYDSYAMRKFVGIDLLLENVPDSTTLLRFRHLLEKNGLQKQMFRQLTATLKDKNI